VSIESGPDRTLVSRLPLPLAQLYLGAHTAPTPLEAHSRSFFLWEAMLKLLGSVALVHYAALPHEQQTVTRRLANLARPSLGHWWEFVRLLVPLLAERGDRHFAAVQRLLLETPTDIPVLTTLLEGLRQQSEPSSKARPGSYAAHLFIELLSYRNRELGHGVDRLRSPGFYVRMGRLLLDSAEEILRWLDTLAGRRLLFLTRSPAADELSQLEMIGEVPTPRGGLSFDAESTGYVPAAEQLYLLTPENSPLTGSPFCVKGLLPLDLLIQYAADTSEVSFFNASGGRPRVEYICYATGRFSTRRDPEGKYLPVLTDLLGLQAAKAPRRAAEALEQIRPPSKEDTQEAAPPEAVPPTRAAPPRQIGEFEVVCRLGQGHTSELLRGWQPLLERPVLLKCLTAVAGSDQRERFLQEIRVLGQARHPNLPATYGSGSQADFLFYAREWIEGVDLAHFLRRLRDAFQGPADLDLRAWHQILSEAAGVPPPSNLQAMAGRPWFVRVADLGRQVASAAQALHQLGIVHRNITPSSILLAADGLRAVLVSLGVAQGRTTDEARTWEGAVIVGTPAYASPEQVQGNERWLDGRSDIYSLGAVLWELLTLRPLRQGQNVAEILEQALADAVEPIRRYNPRVPRDLETICNKCLKREPAQRYVSAQDLADDLRRFLQGEAITAHRRSFLDRVSRWFRRLSWKDTDVVPVVPAAPRPPRPQAPAPSPAPVAEAGGTSAAAVTATTRSAPTEAAGPLQAPDQAFSSQTIVTLYPAPIAITYRRFCQETEPRARLEALFSVLEASVRYLVTLGISDLFHCLAESGRDTAPLLDHPDFDFLRKPRPMVLGKWVGALRETARLLATRELAGRLIAELPATCKPGGVVDANLLRSLVDQRNEYAHPDGSIRIPTEKCRTVLRDYRPCLEEALREIRFVCRYPLGFVSPFAGMPAAAEQRYYHLHSCMGAWVNGTSRALDIKTTALLREDLPFVVTPDGCRLLYLWPLLLERRSAYTGRRTLWVFQEIADHHRPFLTTVRAAAIDVPEDWSPDLQPEPAASHSWLMKRLAALPPAPQVPPELHLVDRLLPATGGKLIGQEIGSNRLLSVVALGGFGTIYAAEAADGARLAVKVMESRASVGQLARFNQEIEKLRLAADHPGVIRCFEHGDVDVGGHVCPWYSMEFALGGDLRSSIDKRKGLLKGQVPWHDPAARAEVCREFAAITEAVAHLHSLQIVHRDIKPGNVLIMEDGSLRLSDFGLVKNLQPSEEALRHGPQSSVGGAAGTPGYMAPEQARGQEVGKTADVYALGVLLAELALGERPRTGSPYEAPTTGSTLQNKSLEKLPKDLRSFIQRCTAVAPDSRPEDAAVLRQTFAELCAQSKVEQDTT
jgi:serine/threonine protein kinase